MNKRKKGERKEREKENIGGWLDLRTFARIVYAHLFCA